MKICDVVTELTAGMMAAAVTLPVVVMVAANIGVEVQLTRCQGLRRFVRIAGDTAVQLDARLFQRHLGTAADAAADERVHLHRCQQPRQSAVSAAARVHHFGSDNLSVFQIVELELICVTEMLAALSVFIG